MRSRLVHRQQIVTGQEVVLGHLAAPAPNLARRQGGQRIEIADDPGWLPERSDQVLAPDPATPFRIALRRDVDSRLAADRRIDHADQRRRDVHHRNATVPRGGSEAGDVGDHATTDADHDVVACQTRYRAKASAKLLDGRERLVRLAVPDREHLAGQPRIDVDRDPVLGHDRRTLGVRGNSPASSLARAVPDQHVVAAIAERYPNRDHRRTASATSFGAAIVDQHDHVGHLPVQRLALDVRHALQRTRRIVVEQWTMATRHHPFDEQLG